MTEWSRKPLRLRTKRQAPCNPISEKNRTAAMELPPARTPPQSQLIADRGAVILTLMDRLIIFNH